MARRSLAHHGAPTCRRFIPASHTGPAERLIASRARRGDVYVGVALRNSNSHGGRASVAASHLAWVESDNPRSAELLEGFSHPPSMLIASGTPGHLQAYWTLERRCEAADWNASTGDSPAPSPAIRAAPTRHESFARPGTLNHKHDPPKPVTLLRSSRACPIRPFEPT